IRPTAEIVGHYTNSGHIGVLATSGTVSSKSYVMEIEHQFPQLNVWQKACSMWVPLVENIEYDSPGANYFVRKDMYQLKQKSEEIDTLLLACTHYPLLLPKIEMFADKNTTVLSQGPIVANSLADYLQRHPEIDGKCSKGETRQFLTTDSTENFNRHAETFFGEKMKSEFVEV